jgi:lysyl endopeptidase
MPRRTLFHLSAAALAACTLSASPAAIAAQPRSVAPPLEAHELHTIVLPELDVDALRAASQRDAQLGPFRFAEPFELDVNPAIDGVIVDADAPGRIGWRLRLQSPDAFSLSIASRLDLPASARLYLLNARGETIYRAIDQADASSDAGEFWSPVVPGDTLDLYVTVAEADWEDFLAGFSVFRVHQDFVGFDPFRPASNERSGERSAACHVDVACEEADPWRNQVNAVGNFTINGVFQCSGSMINNTARDGTPYFLTANHCGVRTNNDHAVVIYWNYQNSTCRTPGSAESGGPGDGSLAQFSSGTVMRSTFSAADTTLLELEETPPAEWGIVYNGWDRERSLSPIAVGIHHPRNDEKRIAFRDQAIGIAGSLWSVRFNIGGVEVGSSGSPLIDELGRTIGVTCCVTTTTPCNGSQTVFYGAVKGGWSPAGAGPEASLDDWLDPLNTGETAIDPLGAEAPGPFLLSEPVFATTLLSLEPTTFSWQDAPDATAYTVEFSTDESFAEPVAAFGPLHNNQTSLEVDLGALGPGVYYWRVVAQGLETATISTPGAASFATEGLTPGAFELLSPDDGVTDVEGSVTVAWEPAPNAEAYVLEVSDAVSFDQPAVQLEVGGDELAVVLDTELLEPGTTYFWRVMAFNGAGATPSSPGFRSLSTRAVVNNCLADLDANGAVDAQDFSILATAFGTASTDGRLNTPADLNSDGSVDGGDFGIYAGEFGRSDCLQ